MAWSILSLPLKVGITNLSTNIAAVLIERHRFKDRRKTDGAGSKHLETFRDDEFIIQHCERLGEGAQGQAR